jgi:hypothetical protein
MGAAMNGLLSRAGRYFDAINILRFKAPAWACAPPAFVRRPNAVVKVNLFQARRVDRNDSAGFGEQRQRWGDPDTRWNRIRSDPPPTGGER